MKKIIYISAATLVITLQGAMGIFGSVAQADEYEADDYKSEIAQIVCLEFADFEDSSMVLEGVEMMISEGSDSFSEKELKLLNKVAKHLKKGKTIDQICSY